MMTDQDTTIPCRVRERALAKRLLLLTLAVALPAGGDTFRDAGYGDGSLIDSNGDYFYPQPDGTYLDTYGNLFVPGDGDTIETAPDDPFAQDGLTNWGTPDRNPRAGDPGLTGGDPAQSSDAKDDDFPAPDSDSPGEIPGMYMDVGDGYLKLDTPEDLTGSGREPLGSEATGIVEDANAIPGLSSGDYESTSQDDFNAWAAQYRRYKSSKRTDETTSGLVNPRRPSPRRRLPGHPLSP